MPALIDLDSALSGNVLFHPAESVPAIRLVHTRQKVENGCLSSAVRSDQAVELSLFDRDAEIIDRLQAAEGNTQIFYIPALP